MGYFILGIFEGLLFLAKIFGFFVFIVVIGIGIYLAKNGDYEVIIFIGLCFAMGFLQILSDKWETKKSKDKEKKAKIDTQKQNISKFVGIWKDKKIDDKSLKQRAWR